MGRSLPQRGALRDLGIVLRHGLVPDQSSADHRRTALLFDVNQELVEELGQVLARIAVGQRGRAGRSDLDDVSVADDHVVLAVEARARVQRPSAADEEVGGLH